ncbi:MAG: B-box zinc finger protein [Acidobacteriota bacterium]
MLPEDLTCSSCAAPIIPALVSPHRTLECPRCGSTLDVHVFPALFKPPARGTAGEQVQLEGEPSCYYHAQKKAVVLCDNCGRFLCALCDVAMAGGHYCPQCLDRRGKVARVKTLENHRVLYDSVALSLAIVPLLIFYFVIITAPIAIFVAIRHWNSPGSLVRRTKIRFVVAIALGCIEFALCVLFIYALFFARRG